MKKKTMKDLAREALQVQDACNLSGVVHGFARAISDLRELLPDAGTDAINTHLVCVLWADKIAHLTNTQTLGSLADAYSWANKNASNGIRDGNFEFEGDDEDHA